MKPIHKFNGGLGATICGKCSVIISIGLTEDLYCEKCKYIEDTLDMKETTKCYCGHTTTCDCGPEEHVELINSNIEEFDKAIELSKQETVEEYYLPLIKNMLEYTNDALAMRFMEKYYHAKKEQDEKHTRITNIPTK
jgi:hypothetical protein